MMRNLLTLIAVEFLSIAPVLLGCNKHDEHPDQRIVDIKLYSNGKVVDHINGIPSEDVITYYNSSHVIVKGKDGDETLLYGTMTVSRKYRYRESDDQ